jgi:hypothetical protein
MENGLSSMVLRKGSQHRRRMGGLSRFRQRTAGNHGNFASVRYRCSKVPTRSAPNITEDLKLMEQMDKVSRAPQGRTGSEP